MNAPLAFYYLLTWCDAFRCTEHEFPFAFREDCVRLARYLAENYQATGWCNPVTLLTP